MTIHDQVRVYDLNLLPPRIRNKIKVVGECWIWTGCLSSAGKFRYGHASYKGKLQGTHRITYTILVGPIPRKHVLDHVKERCRDTRCCFPGHLEAVTSGVNVARGSSPIPLNALKTHCPRGHPYDGYNVAKHKQSSYDGWARTCRTCHREKQLAYTKRLKVEANIKWAFFLDRFMNGPQ